MPASTRRRSRSACQSRTGSAPAYRTARAASVSSSDPGNVTTPIRTTEDYPTRSRGLGQRNLPADALVEGDPGALPGGGAQGPRVPPGLHDREAAAGLGQLAAVGVAGHPAAARPRAALARVADL